MQQYAPQESGAPQAAAREAFAPLPLRARGTLELLDASIKLYRQYFGVLLAWSAIVSSASVLGAFLRGGGLLSFVLTPMLVGAIVCCVAASVRGQRVSFSQCWDFTKPRYGPLIGAYLLSLLVVIGLIFLIGIVFALVVAGFASLSSGAGGVGVIVSTLVLIALSIVAFIRLTIWMGMVPIVVAMEEDKRSNSALSRANELLKGHYGRITGLMVLLGLGYLVLMGIMLGIVGLITGADQLRALSSGRPDSAAFVAALAGIGTSFTLLSMLTTPLFYLIIALFYLDVRVRKEALDLEWSAHATAPVAPEVPQQAYGQQAYGQPATGFTSPANMVPGAPAETTYAPNPAYPPPEYAPPVQYPTATPYPNAPAETPAYNAPSPYSPDAAPMMPPQETPSVSNTFPNTPTPTPFASDITPASMPPTAPPFANQPFETSVAAPPFSDALPIETSYTPPIEAPDFTSSMAQPAPQDELTCANCGAKAPRGQRFCMQCGSNLPAA